MLLKDKKAIVTGGTSGIGKAIALLFAEHGADVCIFGIDEKGAQTALAELDASRASDKQKMTFELVDVSKYEIVEKAIGGLVEKWENVDILVNNAGITKDNFLMRMSEAEWDAVLAVNLKSVFNTCHALIRTMMKAKYGKIINIASVVGIMGNVAQANYAASKAGVIGFSKSLAKEVAKKGICINCVAPGYIKTQMTDVLPDSVKDNFLSQIPMNKMGLPLDVAKAVLFLASHLSDYITGQVIQVDGGMLM